MTHADPGLLTELAAGIPTALADSRTGEVSREQLAALWSYWIDEASADVLAEAVKETDSATRLAARVGPTTREEEDALVDYLMFLRSRNQRKDR